MNTKCFLFSMFLLNATFCVLVGCRPADTYSPRSSSAERSVPPEEAKAISRFDTTPDPINDIFAKIWNLTESHVTVSKAGGNGQPIDSSAQIVVHEQGRAGDCLDEDNAAEPLLVISDESLFAQPTFKTAIALFDNYVAAEQRPEILFEDADNQHWVEVEQFLDAVFATKPMMIALEHVQNELAPGKTYDQIRADVKKMWFEPFTNHYGGEQPFCVGFEHVFIGEDESNAAGAPRCKDRVGGYHSWIKFYREQQTGKADYLGYDYPEGNVADALADPKITTMVMKWSPTAEEDGSYGHHLLKKPGGFFVGTRPELEIVFGMLAMYAQKAGTYDNVEGQKNHHRVKLGNNYVDLVMHPESLAPPQGQPARRGNHIRTLYPKFRGATIPGDRTVGGQSEGRFVLPTQPHNDAPIRIARALPNPAAPGDVGEWIELSNVTEDTTLDVSTWRLSDQLGREKHLSGELVPGESTRIMLDRIDQDSMMLKNSEGWILLFQGEIRRAAVRYASPQSGEIVKF